MSENSTVIKLINERIEDERLRRKRFYDWLVAARYGERDAARMTLQSEESVRCPKCGGSGTVKKTLHGKAVNQEARAHCELCGGVGNADGLKVEEEALRIRAVLAGKRTPKVPVSEIETEMAQAQKQLEVRDRSELARLEREAEAKRILEEAEAKAKAIREGR